MSRPLPKLRGRDRLLFWPGTAARPPRAINQQPGLLVSRIAPEPAPTFGQWLVGLVRQVLRGRA